VLDLIVPDRLAPACLAVQAVQEEVGERQREGNAQELEEPLDEEPSSKCSFGAPPGDKIEPSLKQNLHRTV